MSRGSSPVLVVGGGSGIGRGCAEVLAERGWTVANADLRRPDRLPGGTAEFYEVDIRDHDAVEVMVSAAEADLGPVNACVCAAGTARVTGVLDISPKEWDLIIGVNLTGTFNVLRATTRRMVERGGGSFVAISSVDGDDPVAGLGHYCASKAGVDSLVRVAALELGQSGVRVNSVAPGVVETPLMKPMFEREGVREDFLEHIPLGRTGRPSDIATAVSFMLSDDAAYVTGQSLKVDGGMSLREHARLLPE